MFGTLNVFVVVSIQIFFVECLIPSLTVRRIDRKLIAKKRQDTLEMCRLFNNENVNLKHTNAIDAVHRRRRKREVSEPVVNVNPALNEEDTQRVENIVEKLYDDMEARGEAVNYKQAKKATLQTTAVDENNATARRFAFAPAKLLGPLRVLPQNDKPADMNVTPTDSLARFRHGIIPYYIDSKTYDSQLSNVIISAFDYFEKATCIRLQKLRELPTDQASMKGVNWIYITNPSGIRQCVHTNERRQTSGVQMIVLGYDCMSLGDIVHEMMHVLGFSHEHLRSDRDQHITVLWNNIKPGYKKYFEIPRKNNGYNVESLPYDHASVMHYPARAFSKNGQATILTETGLKIGQREGLSEVDVEKVGLIYGSECVQRNQEYLLKTCPSVVKANKKQKVEPTQKDIEEYFKDRLWPFGIVNYKIRDKMEFSAEERENIQAVIRHISKETCIQFSELPEEHTNSSSSESSVQIEDGISEANLNSSIVNPVQEPKNETYTTKASMNIDTQSENEVGISDNENKTINNNSTVNLNMSTLIEEEIESGNPQNDEKEINQEEDLRSQTTLIPTRRHSNSILVLSRSNKQGCECPTPGKPDGNKMLEISSDCFNSVNDLLHVFVHVLGLDHQHNMHDRDQFLHIVWNNLSSDVKEDMMKTLPPAASIGFPYDYQSVMHYPWLQIKNGVSNMMYPVWNDGWAMGHWQGLSSTDVQKLNLIYFKECVNRSKYSSI